MVLVEDDVHHNIIMWYYSFGSILQFALGLQSFVIIKSTWISQLICRVGDKMQDKATLINSMNNLINHITITNRNQQQMFNSLTRRDFDKIINNLEDPLLKLRLTTVHLLTQLLYNNQNLKQKFCGLMNIHYSRDSNVVLNNNMARMLGRYGGKIGELYPMLRQISSRIGQAQSSRQYKEYKEYRGRKQPLFWYINMENDRLQVQQVGKQQMSKIISKIGHTNSKQQKQFDPLTCVFGLTLCASQLTNINKDTRTRTTQSNNNNSDSKQISNKQITRQNKQGKQSKQGHRNIINIGYNNNNRHEYMPVHNSARATISHNHNNGMDISMNNNYVNVHNTNTNGNYSNRNYSNGNYSKDNKYGRKYYQQPSIQMHSSMNLQNNYVNPAYLGSNHKKQKQSQFAEPENIPRLSLQPNYYKPNSPFPSATTMGPTKSYNYSQFQHRQSRQSRDQQGKLNTHDHHHGIKLMTPRQSLGNKGNNQKLTIINGPNTDRYNPDKSVTFPDSQGKDRKDIREKNIYSQSSNNASSNIQKLRTIHLGKGNGKGWETTRDKKNVNVRLHN